jgi:hypothetical protein
MIRKGGLVMRLIIASILCASILCLTPVVLSAQEKPRLVDPKVMFPQLIPLPTMASPNIWDVMKNQQAKQKHALVPPASLVRNFSVNEVVCSVPLLAARADMVDPGIVVTPGDSAVPIRQARVPAPPCKK